MLLPTWIVYILKTYHYDVWGTPIVCTANGHTRDFPKNNALQHIGITYFTYYNLQQGNQRWQIPRPATCQCLVTFTPLKLKILIFFRDVISLLARVFILLIDTATQEVPMTNIWKKLSVQFLRYIRHWIVTCQTSHTSQMTLNDVRSWPHLAHWYRIWVGRGCMTAMF